MVLVRGWCRGTWNKTAACLLHRHKFSYLYLHLYLYLYLHMCICICNCIFNCIYIYIGKRRILASTAGGWCRGAWNKSAARLLHPHQFSLLPPTREKKRNGRKTFERFFLSKLLTSRPFLSHPSIFCSSSAGGDGGRFWLVGGGGASKELELDGLSNLWNTLWWLRKRLVVASRSRNSGSRREKGHFLNLRTAKVGQTLAWGPWTWVQGAGGNGNGFICNKSVRWGRWPPLNGIYSAAAESAAIAARQAAPPGRFSAFLGFWDFWTLSSEVSE